jgi:hypothetical protein
MSRADLSLDLDETDVSVIDRHGIPVPDRDVTGPAVVEDVI